MWMSGQSEWRCLEQKGFDKAGTFVPFPGYSSSRVDIAKPFHAGGYKPNRRTSSLHRSHKQLDIDYSPPVPTLRINNLKMDLPSLLLGSSTRSYRCVSSRSLRPLQSYQNHHRSFFSLADVASLLPGGQPGKGGKIGDVQEFHARKILPCV